MIAPNRDWGRRLLRAMVVCAALGAFAAPGRAGLVNGSFEDGMNGWTGSGFASATGPDTPTHGSRYAYASFGQSEAGTATIEQAFALPTGLPSLVIDLYVLRVGFDTTTVASLFLADNSEMVLWQLGAGTLVPPGNEFYRYEYDVSAYAGQQATLRFSIDSPLNTSGSIGVDRILFVPEPRATAALGLGVMALAARRRVTRAQPSSG